MISCILPVPPLTSSSCTSYLYLLPIDPTYTYCLYLLSITPTLLPVLPTYTSYLYLLPTHPSYLYQLPITYIYILPLPIPPTYLNYFVKLSNITVLVRSHGVDRNCKPGYFLLGKGPN